MNFPAALQYPFRDKNWPSKILTATLLMFVPIFGWLALMGYGLRIAHRVAEGDRNLPEWRDFGQDFNNGLMVFIGTLIYAIPILIFGCLAAVVRSIGGGEAALLVSCCVGALLFVYMVIMTPLVYSAIAHYSFATNFSEFYDIPERIQETTSHFEQALLLLMMSVILWFLIALPIALVSFSISLLFSDALIGLVCLIVALLPSAFAFVILTIIGFNLAGQWGRVIGVNRFANR